MSQHFRRKLNRSVATQIRSQLITAELITNVIPIPGPCRPRNHGFNAPW